jgi:uncharacterized RDD family membrane protein YckC
MSSMPQGGSGPDQGDAAGQGGAAKDSTPEGGAAQGGTPQGGAAQGGAAGDRWIGTPQGKAAAGGQWTPDPQGAAAGNQGTSAGQPGQRLGTDTQYDAGAQWRPEWGTGPRHSASASPVPERLTRVTGRRVVQYIIDHILAGIIPAVLYWGLDRGTGVREAVGALVASVLTIAIYILYWVVRPYVANGQTFGMQLLGIRVIRKDGGRASIGQLFGRAILLIVDLLFFGLVGLITMLCSRYRQRVGDHAAKTLVIRNEPAGSPGQAEWQQATAGGYQNANTAGPTADAVGSTGSAGGPEH